MLFMKPTIKAIVFDVYGTLFDVHSVKDACEQEFPEKGAAISQVWRTKQFLLAAHDGTL